jgi:hypothetical protein
MIKLNIKSGISIPEQDIMDTITENHIAKLPAKRKLKIKVKQIDEQTIAGTTTSISILPAAVQAERINILDIDTPEKIDEIVPDTDINIIGPEPHNKGTGAGGSNTNHNGIAFETKTCNEHRLLSTGFVRKNIPKKEKTKYGYYLEKIYDNHSIHFVMQNGLKYYMREFHQKELFREVDEAYIVIDNITHNITVKILEKKNQNNSGSVEDKLCLGHYFKFVEYPSCLGENFQVEYAFCISIYLKNLYNSDHKKWKILKESNEKNNIPVLFGDDDDYYSKLDEWINS